MDYFGNLSDSCMFSNFVKEFNDKVKIDQFRRINDTTISWTEHPRLGYNRTPNIFIKLVFDEENVPFFELLVKFSNDIVCFHRFMSPTDAIDYVNSAINSIRERQQYCDELWHLYCF